MLKKYIVRLTDEERETLQQVVNKFKGSSQKVRRARVLLKADAEGPGWTDAKIADAFDCRTKTVENIRERFVTEVLRSRSTASPGSSRPAEVAGWRAGSQADRAASGSAAAGLRIGRCAVGRTVVALEIVEAISYETVRRTLKKMG